MHVSKNDRICKNEPWIPWNQCFVNRKGVLLPIICIHQKQVCKIVKIRPQLITIAVRNRFTGRHGQTRTPLHTHTHPHTCTRLHTHTQTHTYNMILSTVSEPGSPFSKSFHGVSDVFTGVIYIVIHIVPGPFAPFPRIRTMIHRRARARALLGRDRLMRLLPRADGGGVLFPSAERSRFYRRPTGFYNVIAYDNIIILLYC